MGRALCTLKDVRYRLGCLQFTWRTRRNVCGKRGQKAASPNLNFWKISLVKERRMYGSGKGEGRARGQIRRVFLTSEELLW